jgi:cytochrome oxidase Cu insertion factor (SCO1/SenC/PrrC family)
VALHALLQGSSGSGALSPATVSIRHGLYGDATWAPGAVPAPPITTLHDQNGASFSLASLHGRTVALVFFDSHCRQECPLEGRQLAAAERRLPAAQRPELVVVSVNPQDTGASVREAIRSWGLAGVAPWHWLMGTHKQLARIWTKYHIQVSPPIDGDINHTEALYLIDRSGYERVGYLWPFASRFATYDMRTLATHKAA